MNDAWYFVVDVQNFNQVKRFDSNKEAAEYIESQLENWDTTIDDFIVFKGDRMNLSSKKVERVEIGGI